MGPTTTFTSDSWDFQKKKNSYTIWPKEKIYYIYIPLKHQNETYKIKLYTYIKYNFHHFTCIWGISFIRILVKFWPSSEYIMHIVYYLLDVRRFNRQFYACNLLRGGNFFGIVFQVTRPTTKTKTSRDFLCERSLSSLFYSYFSDHIIKYLLIRTMGVGPPPQSLTTRETRIRFTAHKCFRSAAGGCRTE